MHRQKTLHTTIDAQQKYAIFFVQPTKQMHQQKHYTLDFLVNCFGILKKVSWKFTNIPSKNNQSRHRTKIYGNTHATKITKMDLKPSAQTKVIIVLLSNKLRVLKKSNNYVRGGKESVRNFSLSQISLNS
eukprot:GEMP01059799.1.p1 GENE.GEMP01059799.1~~GEMP01059799.1.p1  ORF type:complete len:130 (-),score=0.37 GEMP01059799.1:582-971(-)